MLGRDGDNYGDQTEGQGVVFILACVTPIMVGAISIGVWKYKQEILTCLWQVLKAMTYIQS